MATPGSEKGRGLMVEDLDAWRRELGMHALKDLEGRQGAQIRNRNEHMNKIDNCVDYDDKGRREDGT